MDVTVKDVFVGELNTCCYVLWEENSTGCVVIDPGAEAEKILEATAGHPIEAVLLTHGHFDHIAAVEQLMQDGTELIIHRDDEKMLSDRFLNVSWLIRRPLTVSLPVKTVNEGEKLSYAGMIFSVMHTPGHTPGSVCYRLGNWIFSGDTILEHGYGRTDFPGGSDEQMQKSLKRLNALKEHVIFFPGHADWDK